MHAKALAVVVALTMPAYPAMAQSTGSAKGVAPGSRDTVRAYGQRMVADHTQANQQLPTLRERLVQAQGIAGTATPTAKR